MSMISQIFGNRQIVPAGGEKSAPQNVSDAKGQEYLSQLSGGDTVDGKIADIRGNDVTIELPGGGTVSAKLDNAMALTKGQNVTFEVRTTQGNQVSLTPLYTNMNLSATAQKALQAAGMTVNADTLRMTVSMMDEGLGIDRASLGDMYNRVLMNPGTDIRNLVEMSRMGMEINDITVEQYSAFKNYEDQISDGMQKIADGAVRLYEELKLSGDDTLAMEFLKDLTAIITKEEGASGVSPVEQAQTEEAAAGRIGGAEADPIRAGADAAGKDTVAGSGDGVKAEVSGNAAAALAASGADEILLSDLKSSLSELLGRAASGAEDASGPDAVLNGEDPGENGEGRARGGIDADSRTQVEGKALSDAIPGEAGAAAKVQSELVRAVFQGGDPALAQRLAELPPTDRNVLRLVNTILQESDLKDAKNALLLERLRSILDGEDLKTVVKNAMKENWTLKPEQVGDKTNVENLYQRLNTQTRELTAMLTQIAKPDSAMAQSLGNMSNNLDFMNQMNQMYQYVQLPLKMNGSEATGDLFVYSDKKSLAAGDGSVSALLHLDMKYLGALDVYAAISQGNKVSTRFMLESDEMIDFIAEHIHVLNEHLEARGYSVSAKITRHEETPGDEPSGVRRLKETAGKSLLAKQSFDVRA